MKKLIKRSVMLYGSPVYGANCYIRTFPAPFLSHASTIRKIPGKIGRSNFLGPRSARSAYRIFFALAVVSPYSLNGSYWFTCIEKFRALIC